MKPGNCPNQINDSSFVAAGDGIGKSSPICRPRSTSNTTGQLREMRWQLFTGVIALLLVAGSVVHGQAAAEEEDFETDVSVP